MNSDKASAPAPAKRRRRQSRFAVRAPAEEPRPAADVASVSEPKPAAEGNVSDSALFSNAPKNASDDGFSIGNIARKPFSRKQTTNTESSRSPVLSVFGNAAGDSDSESDHELKAAKIDRKGLKRPRPQIPEPSEMRVEVPAQNAPPKNAGPSVDPLDAFMDTLSKQAESSSTKGAALPSALGDEDVSGNAFQTSNDPDDMGSSSYLARTKKKRLVYEKIDHSKVDYLPFQKNLYIEVPEIARMTTDEVNALSRDLGNIRIRGKHCPKPIRSWGQCGLSSAVLELIRKSGYVAPTPIQAQGIPCIMSGRDVIGVARTGSGKTLAFLLPLLRHVGIQSRAEPGDGPAALIIAPTRELAIQIFGEAKRFGRLLGVHCVCAYGGSGVKDQIAELKRGADIVICTPGRMIDLLAMNSGRITNLRRVTLVVLDEADRMFDMGFEPQLTRIVENIRPDRQTVMFSATFPRQVENLARKILRYPVEITVGGNSVAAATIDQHIEVRTEDSKFFRLLELLGVWYERGSTLVFVDRQDSADRIFGDLSKAKYLCLPLHGGRDQADRDSAISDFKNGDVKILVATSVAARGLDVRNLSLVVNYDVPNHYEDYVHRIGRTGRAGRPGTAYTFITKEQESYAPDLVKALTLSAKAAAARSATNLDEAARRKIIEEAVEAAVPADLKELADSFELKRKAGIVLHGSNSGYGGKGFKFDDDDDYNAAQTALRKAQAKRFGLDGDEGAEALDDKNDDGDNADSDDDVVVREINPKAGVSSKGVAPSMQSQPTRVTGPEQLPPLTEEEIDRMKVEAVEKAKQRALRRKLNQNETFAEIAKAKAEVWSIVALRRRPVVDQTHNMSERGAESVAAVAAAAAISAKLGNTGGHAGVLATNVDGASGAIVDDGKQRYAAELEINDYPQHARWQVTRKNALMDVEEFTTCVITTRGNYYPAGRNPPTGQRKLHFLIEGPDVRSVKSARREIKRKLEEASAVLRPSDDQYSKYSVV